MVHRRFLCLWILALPLILCQCQSEGWCTFVSTLSKAGYAVSKNWLGLLAGPQPDWGQLYTDCRNGTDDSAIPDNPATYGAAAVSSRPPPDACSASHETDDPCVACVLANCCHELVACVGEYTCTCQIGRRTPGIDWPEDATCDSADEVTDKALACLSAHCAAECPMK
jgi:hypothetical protein